MTRPAPQSSASASADSPRQGMPRTPTHAGKIEKAKDPRSALSRLLPYLRPFERGIRWVLLLVVLYTFLGLVGPYLMGVAIDHLLHQNDVARLVRLSLGMLTVYLLNNVLQAISGRLMADISSER